MKKHVFTATLIALICLTACEESEDIVPNPTPSQSPSASTTPSFDGADAVLVGVNSITSTQGFNLTVGTAVGLFYNNGELVNVGEVKANNQSLTQQGGTYVYTPGFLSPNGIDFSNGCTWEITGGNSFSNFSYNYNRDFPTVGTISSSDEVSKSANYTLEVSSVTNSDSVLFILGELSHTAASNVTSHTFTVDDMKDLPEGTTAAIVAPYHFRQRNENSKNVYYVSESVITKIVSINN
jgi:hypothetical protein